MAMGQSANSMYRALGRFRPPTGFTGATIAITVVALFLTGTQATLLAGQNVMEGFEGNAPTETASFPPPLRLAEGLSLLPLHQLAPAAEAFEEGLAAIAAWNREGRSPAKEGFSRPLPGPVRVSLSQAGESAPNGPTLLGGGWAWTRDNAITWGTSIQVEASYRLRAELRRVNLPRETRFWVWGETDATQTFGLELLSDDGTLWTPSVAGPTIYLEVSIPLGVGRGSDYGFEVHRLLEVFQLDQDGAPFPGHLLPMTPIITCAIDAACVTNANLPGVESWRRGVARLSFVDGGDSHLCTGSLLANTQLIPTPYLLTANHCFATQGVTNTLEAFWDYIASSCGGPVPSLSSVPRSSGGTLLASSSASDFTFLRLNSIPSNRYFFGWTPSASPVSQGGPIEKLSHPLGYNLAFSESLAQPGITSCYGSTTNFLSSDPRPEQGYGATFGGSSGSAALLPNGQVVGQLSGGCGPFSGEPCLAGPLDIDVDGKFSATYPAISNFLDPAGGGGTCVPDAQTLCLDAGNNDRFRVRMTWTDFQSATGPGFAVPFTSDSGFFYFFNPQNLEVLVKMVRGCGSFSNYYWFYYAAASNVQIDIEVLDVQANVFKTYHNPLGNFASDGDITALATCP